MPSLAVETQQILRTHGLHPRKALGQNFLVDREALQSVVRAAELCPGDLVLEIGPGVGTLTNALADHNVEVVAVELDERLAAALSARMAPRSNVRVIHGNALHLDLAPYLPADKPFKLVANIPYYITAPILRHFLEGPTRPANDPNDSQPSIRPWLTGPPVPAGTASPAHQSAGFAMRPWLTGSPLAAAGAGPAHQSRAPKQSPAPSRPQLIVLMVQKEVAERLTAAPGHLSLLGLSAQFYAHTEIVRVVPATSFLPQPKVDSAIVRLRPYATPPLAVDSAERFFKFVKAGFGEKRKQLHNALTHGLAHIPASRIDAALVSASIERTRRAETLSLPEWGALYEAISRQQSAVSPLSKADG